MFIAGKVRGRGRAKRVLCFTAVIAVCIPLASALCVAFETVDLLTDDDVVRMQGERIGDGTGRRAASCDVNGDGIEDLLISVPGGDGPGNSRFQTGEVYVVYGERGSWAGTRDLAVDRDVWIYGQQPLEDTGISVACGDVNGDGYGDIVLGAPFSHSRGDARPDAGQAHVILGGPALPAEIDLLSEPGVEIFGAIEEGLLADSDSLAVGDLDGDGFDDLVLAAVKVPGNSPGVTSNAGRVYVVLGRETWPPFIDLFTDADVIVFGGRNFDGLGASVFAGDINNDQMDELLAVSSGGDGAGDLRTNAGDINVLWGRQTWSAQIDLAIQPPDILLYGADEYDAVGTAIQNLGVGNIDGDLFREIHVGSSDADGKNNAVPLAGEARGHEPGLIPSPQVDLGVDWDLVAFGAEEGDNFCAGLRVGDVNGDRRDDLACNAPDADGSANMRLDSGEIHVFFGPRFFPVELEIAENDQNLSIYGAAASDGLILVDLADLNGDGINELVGATLVDSDTELPSVWLISPFDVDGDGITQLPDNCPRIFNPDQADSDEDLVGDGA